MPLRHHPHTVTWLRAAHDVQPDGRAGPTRWEPQVAIRCQLLPESADATFREWGIELRDAWLLLADPGPAKDMVVGDRVAFGDELLEVATPPRVYSAEPRTNYVAVLLQKVGYGAA